MTTPAPRQVAREIGVDLTDRVAMRMIECGLHSGFPTCCVAFFVRVWWPWMLAIDGLSTRRRADAFVASDDYAKWTTRPGYVACPKCVVDQNFVEVKACDCLRKRKRAR